VEVTLIGGLVPLLSAFAILSRHTDAANVDQQLPHENLEETCELQAHLLTCSVQCTYRASLSLSSLLPSDCQDLKFYSEKWIYKLRRTFHSLK
jgi:hypothetical protein